LVLPLATGTLNISPGTAVLTSTTLLTSLRRLAFHQQIGSLQAGLQPIPGYILS
jgi:hypothetical protein